MLSVVRGRGAERLTHCQRHANAVVDALDGVAFHDGGDERTCRTKHVLEQIERVRVEQRCGRVDNAVDEKGVQVVRVRQLWLQRVNEPVAEHELDVRHRRVVHGQQQCQLHLEAYVDVSVVAKLRDAMHHLEGELCVHVDVASTRRVVSHQRLFVGWREASQFVFVIDVLLDTTTPAIIIIIVVVVVIVVGVVVIVISRTHGIGISSDRSRVDKVGGRRWIGTFAERSVVIVAVH
mmetsp:Transcript_13115/g.22500  ORF Transcript_13115/g.22500 Transcript_13115/m.22500 type:complete len:235 (+) Transcript_13115:419-1123(+)